MSATDIFIAELLAARGSQVSEPLEAVVLDAVASLQELQGVLKAGPLVAVRNLLASAPYTPTPGTNLIWVKLWGGGGGGGGAITIAANATLALSGGGAGYCEQIFKASALVFPLAVTIGLGGAGGDATGSSGLDGAPSTFSTMIAAAGIGGTGDNIGGTAPATLQPPGGGNVSSGGFFAQNSFPAQSSIRISGTLAWSGVPGTAFSLTTGRGAPFNSNGGAGGRANGGAAGVAAGAVGKLGGKGGDGFALIYEFGGLT